MAQTNAQRQAAYRARRADAGGGQGDKRHNGWISTKADLALNRLARHHGLTRRAMLERLIQDADEAVGHGMTDEEFEAYVTP